ncbi:MAG: Gfo/Idh/MocA family oxidoreductase, partial [Phycisphaerae bacterium]
MTRLASIVDLPATLSPRPDAVRVAQIGLAGGIGYCHLNEYSRNPHFKYVGGYDLYPHDPKVAEASARILKMGGRIYHSFEEVLADPNVEAIDICTPHHFHRPMAVAAFKAGKHVLVEKPMATHPDDLALMLQAQQASGKIGAVQMQHVGRSSMLDLRAALQQGTIGELKEIFLSSLWWRAEDYYARLPWAGRMKVDGAWCIDGALFNQCVHFITQMLILAAPPPPPPPPPPKTPGLSP